MKKTDVQAGRTYLVKVAGNLVPVKITREHENGGWEGTSVKTGKTIRIKSPQRLRKRLADAKPTGPAPQKHIVTKAEYEAQAGQADTNANTAAERDTGERNATGGDTGNEPKRLSILDAAVKVLDERDPADGPLNCTQMVERMTAKGYWSPARGGRTPANTLSAAIRREIKLKGDASRFTKAERGKFALAK